MPVCARCRRELGEDERYCSGCGAVVSTTAPVEASAGSGELPRVNAPDSNLGRTIGGKYRVDTLIGRGGMGRVYRATDLTLDRPVAVKMLEAGLLEDSNMARRFQREARAATRLSHPNSVAILDFGQTDEGVPFLAMEFVAGRSLTRVVAEEFPLAHERVVRIVAQILAAVGEAHAHGVFHCDLKPENVMIVSRRDERDSVKVLDFGVAKMVDPGPGLTKLTQAGTVTGTPGYMSPEQARGEALDGRSDLYSVGVILYEMVAGKIPFDAETPIGLLTRMLVDRPPRPSVRSPHVHVPVALEALIMRALSVDRDGRPASAEAFREALLACNTAERAAAPPSVAPQATVRFEPLPAAPAQPASGATPRSTGQRPARPPARRDVVSALPALIGSTVGALALGALLVYGLTRLTAEPTPAAAATAGTAPPAVTPGGAAGRNRALVSGAPQSLTLPPAQSGEGILTVMAEPGASITVDGLNAGQAPREVQVTAGPHDVRAEHPRLGRAGETVQVLPGQRRIWNATFDGRTGVP
jgi:serine/threonine protein kinase